MKLKKKLNSKAIRKMRRKKLGFGLGTFTACFLSLIVFCLINFIGMKIYYRGSLDNAGDFDLSPKTLRLLDNIKGDLTIYVLVQRSNNFYDEVRNILGEYSFYLRKNTSIDFDIKYIDPDREISRVETVANKFGLDTPNVIVFELDDKSNVVYVDDIVLFDKEVTSKGITSKLIAFKGELAFSSAILDLAKDNIPIVYFLSGHREKNPAEFHKTRGYSKIAALIEQDNIEIKQLLLASARVIPEDAACLIVAAPVESFATFEYKAIDNYLKNGGRAIFLLDPPVDQGLVDFFKKYGLLVGNDTVVDGSLQGNALLVSTYVRHPITENMARVATMFFNPTSLLVDNSKVNPEADKPLVFPLAISDERSWAEKLSSDNKRLHYDAGIDLPGPLPVAVAIEINKSDISSLFRTGKMVVFGDSYFVSNGGLTQGVGGNRTIFLSSLNWLLEREQLLAIPPKNLTVLEINFDLKTWRYVYLMMCLIVPGCFAFLGFFVWFARRK
ncbi:MAG: Gldg family protein [Kiritimatiellae bacterium]|jgi:ABC-2 type transport system permease protein|nr:Gldg family protein [Kiritimatiellia bacterium]